MGSNGVNGVPQVGYPIWKMGSNGVNGVPQVGYPIWKMGSNGVNGVLQVDMSRSFCCAGDVEELCRSSGFKQGVCLCPLPPRYEFLWIDFNPDKFAAPSASRLLVPQGEGGTNRRLA